MEPFDSYPPPDEMRSASLGSTNCRNEYGLKFQQITGQTCCAYCGMSLVDSYEHWLMMSMDHVVPQSTLKGRKPEWIHNLHNLVISCSACNGFNNRYKPKTALSLDASFEDFLYHRDEVFRERKQLIEQAHMKERETYEKRLWEKRAE